MAGSVVARPRRTPLRAGSIGTITIPTWEAAGALVGVTLGTLTVEATRHSVGFRLEFAEDTGTIVAATAMIRPTTRLAHIRPTLPLWPVRGAVVNPALIGGATDLEASTEHEVMITVTDDGDNTEVVVGTATTAAEDIPTHAELLDSATHWVDPVNGSDGAAGTSAGAAWKTLDKAWGAAPSGAVVVLRPGDMARESSTYTNPTGQAGRTTDLTLVAEYPCCDEDGEIINVGRHSVIRPPAANRIAANSGAWAQTTLTGPGNAGAPAGAAYTVWFYASGLAGAQHLQWSETADGPLHRVAHWKRDASHLATAAGAIEKMFTNQSYTYGFYAASNGDLYLRLPGGVDPNTRHWVIGEATAPINSQAALRVCGLKFRGWPLAVMVRRLSGSGAVIDRNWIDGPQFGTYVYSGVVGDYTERVTLQGNRITDANLRVGRADSVVNADVIPWSFIKSTIKNADGTTYPTSKIGASSETVAMHGRGWGRLAEVRRNVIDGTCNGIAFSNFNASDRYHLWVADVHDNTFRRLGDDAVEPDTWASCLFVRDNRVEETLTLLSTGPASYGPIYVLRNRAWRWGSGGVGLFPYETGIGGPAFKYSGTSDPPAGVYVYHNTLWSDDPLSEGGAQYASVGSSPEYFELRGNVIRAGNYAWYVTDAARWTEQDNLFATGNAARGLRVGATIYTTNVAAYRTATSQGDDTNDLAGAAQAFNAPGWLDALLPDRLDGDLAPAESMPAATKVPGVSETIPRPRVGYPR